jgi:hypothetical protein
MDEKSTPIESLNNKVDDTEVVNKLLSKYNNLQDNHETIPEMEEKFENRNMNEEIYNLNSNNIVYKDHHKKEIQRINNSPQYTEDQYEDDEESEYEVIEIPLWKRIVNEIKIPVFIFIFILFFFNCTFDKYLLNKVPILGNKFNECNTYGFLLKAFLISLLSYLFIRFIRI